MEQNNFQNSYSVSFTIIFTIFWDFLMGYQIFFSLQVKQSVIITNKLVYKNVRLYQECLRKLLTKISKLRRIICLVVSPPTEMKVLSVLVKLFLKNRNWIFPVVHYFTEKLEFVSNILWMIVGILLLSIWNEINNYAAYSFILMINA